MSTPDLNKPELKTIADLFDDSGTTYTIPLYQRNFAWQAAQIEQLISDIRDAIDDNKDGYFLGNLIVTQQRKSTSDFEVIDGQQRLTTVYLLLTFLAGEDKKRFPAHLGRLRYQARPRATEALRRIATEGASVHASVEEDAGIHTGYNVIRQYIKQNVTDQDGFADFLRSKVTVVRASLPPETDLNRYFEIMNTRGQQLQQVDIVKARLMSRLENDADRACFAWIWEACADMESYVQMSLTRGNTKLRAQLFGETWSWLTATRFEDLLEAQRDSQSGAGTATAAADPGESPPPNDGGGSLTLDGALAKYAVAGEPDAGEDEENVRFRSTIDFPAFLLHVLKIVKGDPHEMEGQLDDKRLVKRFDELPEQDAAEWVRNFAFKLLRCRNLFDSFILKRQYTTTHGDDGDWSLQRLVKRDSKDQGTLDYVNTFRTDSRAVEEDGDVDRKTRDLLLIQSMLRITFTSARTMHWITMLLAFVVRKDPSHVNEAELAGLLRDYARGKVIEAFPFDNPPVGFSINRIVFTYLDYLLITDPEMADPKKSDFRFSFRNSIEHFYPQHPDEQQSGTAVSESKLDLLGNLALVSVGANSKFSNSLPKAKAQNYKSTIETQSPKLQLMAEITRQHAWGDDEVRDHHDKMIDRLKRDLTGSSKVRHSGGLEGNI